MGLPFLSMDSGYLEENGQQIPVLVLYLASASPSQYLDATLSPPEGQRIFRNIPMTDLYKLLFLSSGAYYQASDELGYQPGAHPDEFAMQEVQERAQEILADWEAYPRRRLPAGLLLRWVHGQGPVQSFHKLGGNGGKPGLPRHPPLDRGGRGGVQPVTAHSKTPPGSGLGASCV